MALLIYVGYNEIIYSCMSRKIRLLNETTLKRSIRSFNA